ncbi:MAG: hypothetical protein ACRC0Y_13725 [Fusobacteriaceae bacterium]
MKKLLMLLSCTISLVAFANEATMNINAVIVKPLTVSHNGDIDFGLVAQNVTAYANDKQFKVIGTPGQKINFTINDRSLNDYNQIDLKNAANNSSIPMYLEERTVSSGSLFTPQLDSNGEMTFKFDAKLVPGTAIGAHTGALNVKVLYN